MKLVKICLRYSLALTSYKMMPYLGVSPILSYDAELMAKKFAAMGFDGA